jgi:hypothetical protein
MFPNYIRVELPFIPTWLARVRGFCLGLSLHCMMLPSLLCLQVGPGKYAPRSIAGGQPIMNSACTC